MSKISSLLLFYLFFFSVSILLHCCCNEPTRISIVGTGEMIFTGITESSPLGQVIDTVEQNSFSLNVNYEVEFVDNFKLPSVMNSAYGFSCEEAFQNRLEESSLSLTCDKAIVDDSTSLAAGEELRNLSDLVVSVDESSVFIFFSQETRAATKFATETHTFTLSIDTSDGLTFESEGMLVFK